jgi:arsenate reductase-like glutaredoxin family protein
MKVIVYTQPGCHSCSQEKEWLAQEHVNFEERNIRENPAWVEEVIALGSQATPTTVIQLDSGEQQVIIGFHAGRLEKYLNPKPQ